MHDFLARHPDLCEGWDHGLIMIGIGAAYDFHTGQVSQAPQWMQHNGLEWFFRLCVEPRRLWKRYAYLNPLFLWYLLLQSTNLRHFSPAQAIAPREEMRYG